MVWAFPRMETDSTYQVHVIVTDWDMGVDVSEPFLPSLLPSTIELNASLNRLAYQVQGEALLTVYSSDGRRVAEQVITGKGEWIPNAMPSGVYFTRVAADKSAVSQKVVVIR